jgi:magnesium-transporting ATPase (P-type)
MLLLILITLLAQLQGLNGQAVDHNGITLDEKKQALEREMLNPFTLTSVVRPCSINFNDNPARGQQTSAEWLRIVFHDMITANLAGPGLGYVFRCTILHFFLQTMCHTNRIIVALMLLSALNQTVWKIPAFL